MTTEEKKKQLTKKVAAERAKRTKPANQRVTEMPLLPNDVVTFKVPNNGSAGDLYRVIKNGDVEFDAILDINGRPVSVKALVGRRGNGINMPGETRDERCDNLLALIDEKGEISYTVEDVRKYPSTNPKWADQRIVNWRA